MLSIQRRKRVEFVSDRFAGYVGRRPLEDVRSNEWISAVHPDDRERIFAVQQTSTDSIEPFNMLLRIADISEPFIVLANLKLSQFISKRCDQRPRRPL